jgi:hypothetical protein
VIARFAPDGRVPPLSLDTRPPVASLDSGVGSSSSAMRKSVTVDLGPPGIRLLRANICSAEPPGWFAVGVGSDEHPLASMGGADGRSR